MITRFGKTSRHESASIDMAPMIDCVFLLLIFFIVTSVFVSDPGVEVDKPSVAATTSSERNPLLIAITADDRIFFDGQQIQVDQVASFLRQAAFSRDPLLIVRADRAARHGTFAAVYAEAKRAGIPHIQFATANAEDH